MAALSGVVWPPANGGPATSLIVMCHGANASGDAMARLVTAVADVLPGALFAAPNGPQPSSVRPQMWEWFSPPYVAPIIGPRVAAAAAILDRYIDEQLAQAGLRPDAYALGGFSQGALVTLHAGLRRPVPPRAIVAAAGILVNPLPNPMPPIATRVQLISGLLDRLVLPKFVRDTEAAMRDAGIGVEPHYIAGLGHEITPQVLSLGATFLYDAMAGLERGAQRGARGST